MRDKNHTCEFEDDTSVDWVIRESFCVEMIRRCFKWKTCKITVTLKKSSKVWKTSRLMTETHFLERAQKRT